VHDGNVEALGEVAGEVGAACVPGIGGEPDLVVCDDVQRAAGAVAFQPGQVDGLGDHPLRRECGVAVDQDRQHAHGLVVGLDTSAVGLPRPRVAHHHRVDGFQMARVRHERHGDFLAAPRLENAVRSVMVLHIARAAHRRQRLLHLPAALELR
jgi:hypothetical protein